VKRAAIVAALAVSLTASLAGTAEAAAPLLPAGKPVAVYAYMTPRVILFGDPLDLDVTVLVDRKLVDPKTVQVTATLRPFLPGDRSRTKRQIGNVTEFHFAVAFTCVRVQCVPVAQSRQFQFPRGTVTYRLWKHPGTPATERFRLPLVLLLSQVNTTALQRLLSLNPGQRIPPYRHHLLPVPKPSYRIAPATLAGISSAAAAVVFAASLLLFRLYARARRPVRIEEPVVRVPPLEQALAFLRHAQAEGDEVLVRKALERVAAELESDGGGALAREAHELAWAETDPPRGEVEQLVERAEQAEAE
jgi:hypothetical protein